jgi:DNA polymerase sigma
MVFIPKKTKNLNICDIILELSNHFSSLNKYDKVTPIYTASIPLIKLMIKYNNYLEENKSLLDNYTKLINSPIYKNYPYDVESELSYVNIDISFPVNYNNKKNKNTPFQQIEFVKSSLSTYVEANIVIRILKRALKLTDMNNSYKGGLSSYTIFLLVISYMKNINKNNNANTKHKSNTYGHAFHDVVKFFSKFDFYANIIDIGNKNGDIYNARNKKYNSSEYDNIPIIIDPVTGLNAGKSTFRINDVQSVFIALNEELERLRSEYDKNNNNNNKNNKGDDKNNDNDINNLIITLLKNVENNYLNK